MTQADAPRREELSFVVQAFHFVEDCLAEFKIALTAAREQNAIELVDLLDDFLLCFVLNYRHDSGTGSLNVLNIISHDMGPVAFETCILAHVLFQRLRQNTDDGLLVGIDVAFAFD